jgi:nucleoside-diphosphate-sugar epimerase
MMESLQLTGRETVFGNYLAERLERIGIQTNSEEGLHIICCADGDAVDCDMLIRPSGSISPPTFSNTELVLHDLYIPSGSGDWGPSEIEQHLDWLVNSSGESPIGEARHWVHIRDVVDMVALLLDDPPTGRIDVCGRRCWSNEAMSAELEMLFSRVKAAEKKTFQLENLKIFEPKVEPTVAKNRPDLSPLHSALQAVGEVGWHPLVPFRVGLMECIAYQLE